MGLLNWNAIDIEINLYSGDNEPKAAKVKLRDIKDIEECERLIDKLSPLLVTHRQDSDK